jgi:uncharacterized protein
MVRGSQAQAQTTDARPPFWRAVRDGKTVSVLGGFHAMRPQQTWLTLEITEAIRNAATVFLEAPQEQGFMSQMQSVMVMGQPSRGRVKRVVKGNCREKFEVLSNIYGLARFRVEEIRPQFAAFLVNAAFMADTRRYAAEFGLDHLVARNARPGTLKFLEDGLDAARAFAKAKPDAELTFLCSTLDNLDRHASFVDEYIGAWRGGSLDQLRSLDASNPNELEANALGVRQFALVNRNMAWIKRIEEELHKTATLFVGVGFQHVFPPDGLLALLGQAGFVIEEIAA